VRGCPGQDGGGFSCEVSFAYVFCHQEVAWYFIEWSHHGKEDRNFA
jgi:hypothetical protein